VGEAGGTTGLVEAMSKNLPGSTGQLAAICILNEFASYLSFHPNIFPKAIV